MSSLQTSTAVTSVLAVTFTPTTGSFAVIAATSALPYLLGGALILGGAYVIGEYVKK